MSAPAAQRREPLTHLPAYLLGRVLFGLLQLLPLRAARAVGRTLGGLEEQVGHAASG